MRRRERILGGVLASALGDALGVPVEFQSRASLHADPVTGLRAEGTHGMPRGTWSDDTSLLLCTLEGLRSGTDPGATMALFHRWMNEGYWTATGEVFDVGGTTARALAAYARGVAPLGCGLTAETSNGNGSLMRILPVAYEASGREPEERRRLHFDFSALTHAHVRSQLACWLYGEVIGNLLEGRERKEAVDAAHDLVGDWCAGHGLEEEWGYFSGCTSLITRRDPGALGSSGYVIHTLEASLYAFLATASATEALLLAVNLGEDTDTTGAVTGGLVGTSQGEGSLDPEWLGALARVEEIRSLAQAFADHLDHAGSA